MEQQPQNPYDRNRRIPAREKLESGEIDLTGSVQQPEALADVIFDAVTEAGGVGEKIPDWGARVIARELANRIPVPGTLHHYAVTGSVDHLGLARELAIHAQFGDVQTKELCDMLGLYLIKQPAGRPGYPADTTTAVEQGLQEHGAPFWAYLQLHPGEAPDDVVERFNDFHVGSFAGLDDVVDELTEIKPFMDAIKEAEERWGFEDFVTLDQERLERTVRATWDVIEFDGKFHVFMR
ncbi:hypothetical protein [Amycolatopsis vastitatis]|uniref:Uncharacterized protein n=1 Tax=Amycolatopsis vastitatis TaxID=1905142 RepID=A0A229T2B2_9PSEU|nr:hypothetical protein [Amycolatopsis vastitatis]OXM65342.1 hypothetical protein CF165_23745 [Amycolatopsis vastitatis]